MVYLDRVALAVHVTFFQQLPIVVVVVVGVGGGEFLFDPAVKPVELVLADQGVVGGRLEYPVTVVLVDGNLAVPGVADDLLSS